MYRIELEPGDVGVFRSVEEIATAIKSGVVTPRARIYHQATDKWLPIEFHPHYKKALELVASGGGQASSSPASSSAPVSSSSTPSGPRAGIRIISAPRPAVAVVEPEPEPEPVRKPQAAHPEPVTRHEPVARHEPVVHEEPVVHGAPVAYDKPVARYEPVARNEPIADHEPVLRTEPHAAAEPVLTSSAVFIPLDPPAAPEAAHPSPDFPAPEPRPIVRPRLRVELAGKPRRPFLLALTAVVVVLVTQLGLTAAVPQRLGDGIRSLALLLPSRPAGTSTARAPATNRAALAATAPKAAPAQAPARMESGPQGSPSFGSSSAFTAAAPGTPAPARAEPPIHGPAPAAGGQLADSIVAIAPTAGDIAVGAPLVPVTGKPAGAGRMTAAVLVSRYQAAYAAAQAELETGFQTAGFANLFAPDRLDSPKGVQVARLAAGTASAYVARYRRREAEIEQAYADSFAVLSKQLNWSAEGRKAWEKHQVLQEKPEIAKLASFLLEQIDSLYGVLSSQEGAYDIKDGQITFQDAKAAHAYAEIRPWLDRRANLWADTASGVPTTAARVLRAMGATKLPEGGAF
jgi:hypothetical protein